MDLSNIVNCYVHYHEHDYAKLRPTLVVQGECGSCGYEVDPYSGKVLDQVCICSAWNVNECACGMDWEEEDYDN